MSSTSKWSTELRDIGQSQGSVERGNKDIEDLLYTWMSTNKTRWADALPSIRFMKNTRYHKGIGMSLSLA